jgi:hypothetical protein
MAPQASAMGDLYRVAAVQQIIAFQKTHLPHLLVSLHEETFGDRCSATSVDATTQGARCRKRRICVTAELGHVADHFLVAGAGVVDPNHRFQPHLTCNIKKDSESLHASVHTRLGTSLCTEAILMSVLRKRILRSEKILAHCQSYLNARESFAHVK